ncbi:MAG TPA: DUF1698 domain-containing protein [Candidatus Acidoferrales bacterium]|nr:DUF1698 domain-containing protein [Candidatus Acidoferrales bacterium]
MDDSAALAARAGQYFWHHSIDLGNGVVTRGSQPLEFYERKSAMIFDPVKVEGATVLDIGAWNGYFSFEAKRRGAARVLATDHFAWVHPELRGRETFEIARSALGADVEARDIDVTELSPHSLGETFDIVLFLGVFYHLFDPIDGLRRAASLAKDVLILETHTDLEDVDRPAMVMYPGSELNNDATNWWGPNAACVIALLKCEGFTFIEGRWFENSPRRTFHAWRTQALRVKTA